VPEYLAPGVYVEETSFRSKSIEGVSTSTTAFAGPTRKGPIGGTPELITSFGDFQRIYGGLKDLTFKTNYLAHAVRAYFNEGGSRLYVSRVYVPSTAAPAASIDIVGSGQADVKKKASFVARYLGDAGNGVIRLRQVSAPATRKVLERAPDGTTVRIGGKKPAAGAQLKAGKAPFSLPHDGVLRLVIDGGNVDIPFRGARTEVIATAVAPDPLAADTTLNVDIDGVEQQISLPTGLTRAELVEEINRQLRSGYARLTKTGAGEAPANRLVIGSDRRGKQAVVIVSANADLSFAGSTVRGSDLGTNNVGDLLRVTADEIDALLPSDRARASLNADGELILTTVTTGTLATLQVVEAADPTKSVHALFGFVVPTTVVNGADGTAVNYYLKQNGVYTGTSGTLNFGTTAPNDEHADGSEFITVTVFAEDKDENGIFYEDMAFDKRHPRWLGNVLAEKPSRRADQLENMFAIRIGDDVDSLALRASLFPPGQDTNNISLSGGSDGVQPIQGDTETPGTYEAALKELEKLDDVSIVAAPGYSSFTDYQGIQGAVIAHAEKRRSYRIAVLDTPEDQLVSGARSERGRIDSKYAAMYYPWIVISNPLARPGDESIPRELKLPPSGFVCGIYARNDIERGVFKAPANEVVRAALRFETDINFAEQEVLNPMGVNCLRFFSGRGYRVWGARTASSDPEWKYVNIRRYFNYLESSIDRGTQWAVFEPNGERLWANVRDTVAGFLYNEWKSGALLGTTQQEAFFVRCDRSTMTQNDLDNGRLICEIGVAAIKPAEFVIFRIGQKTADARS
jgi:phage tail sheath protein FI